MTINVTISSDPTYYGPEATQATVGRYAARLQAHLEENYAADQVQVKVRPVSKTRVYCADQDRQEQVEALMSAIENSWMVFELAYG
jgi:hypothetical protein